MQSLKGSKTEKNLQTALAENLLLVINILIMHLKHEKMVTYRLPKFLRKQLIMRRNMPKFGLSI